MIIPLVSVHSLYTTLTGRFSITMVLRSLLPSVLLERAALRDVTHAQTPYKVVKATPLNVQLNNTHTLTRQRHITWNGVRIQIVYDRFLSNLAHNLTYVTFYTRFSLSSIYVTEKQALYSKPTSVVHICEWQSSLYISIDLTYKLIKLVEKSQELFAFK